MIYKSAILLSTMTDWQKALEKFIAPWKASEEVEGIFLVGSRSTGIATKNSDIDVQIVLSNKVVWKERGTKAIGNFIIDYSATPVSTLISFFDPGRKQARITAHKLATGTILFDRKGVLAKLQKQAHKELKKKFPIPNKNWVSLQKYLLWFQLRTLEDLFEQNNSGFYYECRMCIRDIIETYAIYKRSEVIPSSKIFRYLTDKDFAKAYSINAFPDKVFNKYLLSSLTAPNAKEKIKRIRKLSRYVIRKMGGINIMNWKLRTSVEK